MKLSLRASLVGIYLCCFLQFSDTVGATGSCLVGNATTIVDSSSCSNHAKLPLIKSRFQKILEQPATFRSEDEEEKCQRLWSSLSEEDQTIAARTSYAYWYLERIEDRRGATLTWKKNAALKEARRHLVASNGDFSKALDRLIDTCKYRRENNVDLLRSCFLEETDAGTFATKLRNSIYNDMTRQPVIMKGHDNENRTILYKGTRLKGGVSEEEYLTTQLYIAERASACSEFVSLIGQREKMVAVFDFSSSKSAHSPPMKWQLSAIRKVQHLYPERLHKLVLLEPPFWMRGVFLSLRAFLPKSTQDKIQLVNDRKELSKHVDLVGHNKFISDKEEESLDVLYYLRDVPFYCPYDCETYLSNI